MMTPKFQIGDIVQFLGHGDILAKVGALAIVANPVGAYSQEYMDINWIPSPLSKGQLNGDYWVDKFKLFEGSIFEHFAYKAILKI